MLVAALLSAALAAPSWAATVTVDPKGKYKTLKDALLAGKDEDTLTFAKKGLVGIIIKPRTEPPYGQEIWEVAPASLAEQEGVGDGRILEIDGKPVEDLDSQQATDLVRAGAPGTKVRIKVEREGQTAVYTATRERVGMELRNCSNRVHIGYYFHDLEAARAAALQGAEKGDLECQKHVARDRGLKEADQARHAKSCAEAGDRVCQWIYGLKRYYGNGTAKDTRDAWRWIRRSADQGEPAAAFMLAQRYLKGEDVKIDLPLARYWRDLARAGGHQPQYMYEKEEMNKLDGIAPKEPAPLEEPAAPAKAAKTVVSDVDAPSYKKRKERPADVAVVVGVESYPDLPKADWAERDAEAVRAHLVALGFPERNVFVLKGQQATKTALAKELEARLPKLVTKDSTVFFYFSGHGSPDPKTGDGYLVPIDGDPKFLAETGYPLKKLYAGLARLPAKRTIVALDSCFSGAGGRSVLPKGARPLVTKAPEPVLSGSVVALTAAASDEISGASDEQGHGLFTYYLLKGLNEGRTNVGRLAEYLRPKVQDEARRSNRDQTPQLIGALAEETDL